MFLPYCAMIALVQALLVKWTDAEGLSDPGVCREPGEMAT